MLEKKTYQILKYIYRKKNVTYKELIKMTGVDEANRHSGYVSCLIENKFVRVWESTELIEVDGIREHKVLGLKITLAGSAYVEQKRKDSFLFWVPYSITTFIALMNLIGIIVANLDKFRLLFHFAQG